jgi:hypothetical protein
MRPGRHRESRFRHRCRDSDAPVAKRRTGGKELFMIVSLYSVYDRVAKEYEPLFEAKNHDSAIRKFRQQILAKYGGRKEFDLYYCGDFDRERGLIVTINQPDFISFAKIDPSESTEVAVEEAIQKVHEKLDGKASAKGIAELERQIYDLAEKYGDASGEVIALHFRPILEVLNAIAK